MYINSLCYQNVGPIGKLNLTLRKRENGEPIPLIIVGKNGSGKSVLLSNIVDAFYELADKAYNNATEPYGNGHQYYKEISPVQIKIGEKYMIAHIQFQQDTQNIEYLFKSGDISFDAYKETRKLEIKPQLDWAAKNNFKAVTATASEVTSIFEKDIVCYFGPNRYEKPVWLGNKYFTSNDVSTYSLRPKYDNQLNNPISAINISELTLQWLFDVITDSRADLQKNAETGKYTIAYPTSNIIDTLSITRDNVEKLMSAILCEDVVFRMGNRSAGKSRFSIRKKSDGTLLVPSLDALSTGQLALFNIFATIIRYADMDNIDLSYKLRDIKGIVVIDEIELHLHTQLQREILPKLISLFPKIQFVITSHSPLFLLGMKEQFGEEGFDVIDMPSGTRISVEQFSEFENAYQYLTKTEKYQNVIKDIINEKKDHPLIITEGATDWRHMKTAYVHLISNPSCSEWLPNLDFEFLEYDPQNSTSENRYKWSMGGQQLKTMCEKYSLMPQPRKMIFVADADVKDVKTALSDEGKKYKSWGNNVYSIILPVPKHREATPEISIEHYYSDNQIKTIIPCNGVERRLYMGNEFDRDGLSLDHTMLCTDRNSCGDGKIRIIDGHEGKQVYQIADVNKVNLALSKMDFAKLVSEGTPPFDQMDFTNFIPLFEIIRDILAE